MSAKSLFSALESAEDFSALCEDAFENQKKSKALHGAVQGLAKNKRGEFWRLALQQTKECGQTNPKAFALGVLFVEAWLDENQDAKDAIPPAALIDLFAEAHDALFELHAHPQVQERVIDVCERWYLEERPGRERIVAQLIPTIILQSLQPEGSAARVYSLRSTLLMFDLEDESSQTLKKLLIQCFAAPSHLNSTQGRKFLSFAMTLSEEIMLAAHSLLKNQLQSLKSLKSEKRNVTVATLARIYFGTWQLLRRPSQDEDEESKQARIDLLENFERNIVQSDWMSGAIYYKDDTLARTCIKVLNAAFHDNKKDRAVDSMLARLYEPVIWRGLAAVNATVRRNAAVTLFNAFPLHDPEAKIEEISTSLQRQFDAISSLLSDPCGEVRATAVEGTCRILALFWETVPVNRSSKYLQQIVNDLAHDRACPEVRAAAVRALAYMLDYPMTQPALKLALPHLKRHIHDRSSQVRYEMAQLLLKVDSTAGFAFTDICSANAVLLRLAEDKELPKIALTLTDLIAPSFFPVDAPSVEQLKRAKALAMSHFGASQVFFANLHRFIGMNKVVKLALLFGSFIRGRRKEVLESDGIVTVEETVEAINEVHVALESVCVLWESVEKKLSEGEETIAARQALQEAFNSDTFVLPLFEWQAFVGKHEGVLLRLCRLVRLEERESTTLERRILRSIFLADSSSGQELERRVELAVKWNQTERMLKEMVRSLTIYLNHEKEAKRKVDPSVAVRVLNTTVVTLSASSNAPKKSSTADNSANDDVEDTAEEHEPNGISLLSMNEPLQAVFEVARSRLAASIEHDETVDMIAASLVVMDAKLDVHDCLVREVKKPSVLCRALEWCANKIGPLLQNSKRNKHDESEVGDSDASLPRKGTNTLVNDVVDAMVNLSADAALSGCEILESSLYFLHSCTSQQHGENIIEDILNRGVGRLIVSLTRATSDIHPVLSESVQILYRASKDTDLMDEVLINLMSVPNFSLKILFPLVLEGESRVFARRPNAFSKAVRHCLDDILTLSDGDQKKDELFDLASVLSRMAPGNKRADIRKELMRASKKAKTDSHVHGRVWADRIFNLACELDDEDD